MSKRELLFFLIVGVGLLTSYKPSFAQTKTPYPTQPIALPQDTYLKAIVERIEEESYENVGEFRNFTQKVKVRVINGSKKGDEFTVVHTGVAKVTPMQKLKKGDEVILILSKTPGGKETYVILDRYRLSSILPLLLGFFLLIVAMAGKKGFGSILGLLISLGVLLLFIVPQILKGNDPVLISIIGAIFIMIVTIYLSHGFSKQTTVAIFSTAIALTITGLLANYAIDMLALSGIGSENSLMLQFGPTNINLKGLLLGGMIIGALGVLDDITTTQAAAIFELSKTDAKLSFEQLAQKGFSIGKEHVASLVNTLVLAYAGVSLSLFILFVLNPVKQPYWVILNSEIIVEEIARTLTGSTGLILAVPITTIIAAWTAAKK